MSRDKIMLTGMKAVSRAALWTAMTFLLCMLVAAVISVYGFDEYERAWGRGGSFQVLSWVAVAASVGVGICAALGFRVGGESMRPRLAGAAVGFAGSVLVVVSALIAPSGWSGSALLPVIGLCVAVFGIAFAVGRLSGQR
jgi:peptidoglycan/LPS O-acetylase OafA/YrhL